MNTETVVETGKLASAIAHVKANRTEYLIVLILAHLVGLTDKLLEQTNGMCLQMARRKKKVIYNRRRKGEKYNLSKYSGSSTVVTMGKKFRTKKGKWGCYVYINGKRAFFEEQRR